MLDDKKTKQICRLYFNGQKKKVSFILAGGKEEIHPIESIDGLYALKTRIIEAVKIASEDKQQEDVINQNQ